MTTVNTIDEWAQAEAALAAEVIRDLGRDPAAWPVAAGTDDRSVDAFMVALRQQFGQAQVGVIARLDTSAEIIVSGWKPAAEPDELTPLFVAASDKGKVGA